VEKIEGFEKLSIEDQWDVFGKAAAEAVPGYANLNHEDQVDIFMKIRQDLTPPEYQDPGFIGPPSPDQAHRMEREQMIQEMQQSPGTIPFRAGAEIPFLGELWKQTTQTPLRTVGLLSSAAETQTGLASQEVQRLSERISPYLPSVAQDALAVYSDVTGTLSDAFGDVSEWSTEMGQDISRGLFGDPKTTSYKDVKDAGSLADYLGHMTGNIGSTLAPIVASGSFSPFMAISLSIGEVQQSVNESGGELDKRDVAALGLMSSAFEYMGAQKIMKGLAPGAKQGAVNWIVNRGLKLAETQTFEAGTETIQELVNIGAERAATGNFDPKLTDEEIERLANSAVGGFIGGTAVVGMPGGAAEILEPTRAETEFYQQQGQEAARVQQLTPQQAEEEGRLPMPPKARPRLSPEDTAQARFEMAPEWMNDRERMAFAKGEPVDLQQAAHRQRVQIEDLEREVTDTEISLNEALYGPEKPRTRVPKGSPVQEAQTLLRDYLATRAAEFAEAGDQNTAKNWQTAARTIKFVEPDDAWTGAVNRLAQRFGLNAQLFTHEGEGVNIGGVWTRPGQVLIEYNGGAPAAILTTLGHEIVHQMRAVRPDAYNTLVSWMKSEKPEAWAAAEEIVKSKPEYQKISADLFEQEVMAELSQTRMQDILYTIHNKAKVTEAATEPRGVKALREWLNTFIQKAKDWIKGIQIGKRTLGTPSRQGTLERELKRMPNYRGTRDLAEVTLELAKAYESLYGAPRTEIALGTEGETAFQIKKAELDPGDRYSGRPGGPQRFEMYDQAGKNVGFVVTSYDKLARAVYVEYIQSEYGNDIDEIQRVQPMLWRTLIKDAAKEFPNALTIYGERVSGAKNKAHMKWFERYAKEAAGRNLSVAEAEQRIGKIPDRMQVVKTPKGSKLAREVRKANWKKEEIVIPADEMVHAWEYSVMNVIASGMSDTDTVTLKFKAPEGETVAETAETANYVLSQKFDGVKYLGDARFKVSKKREALKANEFEDTPKSYRELAFQVTAPTANVTNRGGTMTAPESSVFDMITIKIADRMHRVYQFQKLIDDLDDSQNVYMAEELYHGKIEERTTAFDEKYTNKIIEILATNKLDFDLFNDYLMARHYSERDKYLKEIWVDNRTTLLNEAIAKAKDAIAEEKKGLSKAKAEDKKLETAGAVPFHEIRIDQRIRYQEKVIKDSETKLAEVEKMVREGKIPTSGLTKAEAIKIFDAVKADKTKQQHYKRAAGVFDSMMKAKLKNLLDYGLITQKTYDDVSKRYKFYAPLKGVEDKIPGDIEDMLDFSQVRGGWGFDIRGDELKHGLGRTRKATHPPFAQGVYDAHIAIIRGERNEVGKRFLKFVRENPSKLWEINKVVHKKVYDKKTNTARFVEDKWAKNEENVISVKVDGQEYYITMYDDALISAMKNLGTSNMNGALKVMSFINRKLAAVNTTLNPEFFFTNFFRDVQTAGINLSTEEAHHMAGAVMRDAWKAGWGIFLAQRGKGSNNEWSKRYKEFEKAGAKIGFYHMHDIDRTYRRLRNAVKRAGGGPMIMTRETMGLMAKLVTDASSAFENGTRLAAFHHAIQSGYSVDRAASLAKNLTVNFNRRGENVWLNSMYLFFNAGVQGTVRLFQAAKSPRVRKVMYGIVQASAILAAFNRHMGGDDEDGIPYWDSIAPYDKSRNFIFILPGSGGKYVKIPMPYGYNVMAVTGYELENFIDALIVKGRKRPGEAVAEGAWNIVDAMISAFNPLGELRMSEGGYGIFRQFVPTPIQPATDIYANETFWGGIVYPEEYPQDYRPDSSIHKKSTNFMAKWVAKTLNDLTGGSEKESGLIDVHPDALQYIFESYTGGVGQFFERTAGLVAAPFTGKEIKYNDIPFFRRMAGEQNPYIVAPMYHENKEEIKQAENQWEYMRKQRVDDINAWHDHNKWKLDLVDDLNAAERKLRALRKKDAPYEDQVVVMKQFNAAYRKSYERYLEYR
jgi:hypothetical protein